MLVKTREPARHNSWAYEFETILLNKRYKSPIGRCSGVDYSKRFRRRGKFGTE